MAELSKLGRYELRRVLGKGAMGVVYEGFDPALNRAIAVKTILKSVVTDEETAAAYSARFVREAKAAARLSHPNIVQVYDFGEQNDIAFLVMEFILGRELRACFDARESFDAAETVRIMGELLGALEFAHEAGVIHRDVKPANVMLDAQRRVKLADFGVARLQDGSDRSKGNTMVGTPAFMSPEQVSGGRIDRRTDVFSAGIVLYQLLTGEQPFKGEGAWTVAKQIMQDEPPRPSTIATRLSPVFDQIVNRALAKKPDQRFASAKEFSAALQGALVGDNAAGAQRGGDAEIEFWRSIQGSSDPAEFEVYLKEFPQGVYADLARIKISKLPRLALGEADSPATSPVQPRARESIEVAKRAEETARLEAPLAQREAEYKKREAELETKREAEAKARADADARRQAEAQARATAEERSHLDAIEKAKRDAQAELAKREAEYRKREAEAVARVEAEAKARCETEERAKKDAEARASAEAKARAEVEIRKKRAAEEFARQEAEMQQREAELRKRAAKIPRKEAPLIQIAFAFVVVVVGAFGAWYWSTSSDEARLATLTAALDNAIKATQQLDLARQRQEELRKQVDVARLAEDDARAKGDQTRLKELQEQTKKAEAEALKQGELVKQREADAKKAEGAARIAEAGKQTESAKAAEKAAQEKLIQERAAQEKAAAEKLAEERAAAEKAAADKVAAEKAAVAKAAPQKPAATKAPAASTRMPAVGDRWVYEAREANHPQRKFQIVVDAQAVTASSVRELVSPANRAAITLTHQATVQLIGIAPGVASLSPYLRAFQELRGGESWPTVESNSLFSCEMNSISCTASARVAGRESVSVRESTYNAWKVVVEIQVRLLHGGGYAELTYWYADEAKRFVKYQSRMRVYVRATNQEQWLHPDMDMELLSYTPAGSK